MLVKHVMNRSVVTAKPNVTIREASEVMYKFRIGSLIVMSDEEILGIVTSTDILKAISENKDVDETKIEDIMSRKIITINSEAELEEAVNLMMEKKIKRLPVLENNKLVGILTASDIMVVEPKLIESIADLISLKLPGYKGG